ncbi:leucine-rich repeat-containing protein 30-like [Protopterus annectens]|uniref:leucine-rich repeat-containing protein 30-like n=1 Tax=Protopterus annectens TaxID=7888 RepID=UPI001CFA2AE1|nr:leucine-rich repeat-containing protein 30-like [Protopterus annectens]
MSTQLYGSGFSSEKHWKYRAEGDQHHTSNKKKLKLRGRELLSLPSEIFRQEELQVLDMSPERESCLTYRINKVPREIGQLRNLVVLIMDTNELQQIPPEVGALENLQKLTLSNNCLSLLPQEFVRLQKLHSLHLANNHFQELPEHVCQLRNLLFLDVSDNKIKLIPQSIQNLQKLQTLLLFHNRLQHLPRSLCKLKNLCTLWLGNNNLKSLPHNFGDLSRLDWGCSQCSSNFDGNPLENPPSDVCQGGPAHIKHYFAMKETGSAY